MPLSLYFFHFFLYIIRLIPLFYFRISRRCAFSFSLFSSSLTVPLFCFMNSRRRAFLFSLLISPLIVPLFCFWFHGVAFSFSLYFLSTRVFKIRFYYSTWNVYIKVLLFHKVKLFRKQKNIINILYSWASIFFSWSPK